MPGYKFPMFMDPEQAARAGAAIANLKGEQPHEIHGPVQTPEPPLDVQAGHPGQIPEDIEGYRETSGDDDTLEGIETGLSLRQALRPPPIATGKGGEVVSGRDPSIVGGTDTINAATRVAPAMMGQGLDEEAQVAKEQAGELVDSYKHAQMSTGIQNAMMLQRQQEDQLRMRQMLDEKDQQTKSFTNNLMQRQSLWHDPGGIMAAIGFAMIAAASPNDPGVGIRLMNQKIQSDWEKRKATADMALGEMRSNIAGYRMIAGDRYAGDQLALAESYRAGAMDLERIGAHYKGPAAQAFVDKAKGELLGKAATLEMQVMQHINISPTFKDPRIAAAQRNRPEYQNFVPQSPSAGQSISRPQYSGKMEAPKEQGLPPHIKSLMQRMESRVPGSSRLLGPFYNEVNMEAMNNAGGPTRAPVGSPAQLQAFEKVMDQAEAGKSEIAKQGFVKEIDGKRQLMSMVQKDWNQLKNYFGGDNAKMADFMGGVMRNFPGTQKAWNEFWANSGYGSSITGSQRARIQAAAERFNGLLSEQVGGYYHERAGSALSDSEREILKQTISNSTDPNGVDRFLNSQSRQLQANLKAQVLTSPSKLGAYMYLIERGIDPGLTPNSGVDMSKVRQPVSIERK